MGSKAKKTFFAAVAAAVLCLLVVFSVFAGTGVSVRAEQAQEPYDYALIYKRYEIKDYEDGVAVRDPRGNAVTVTDGGFTPSREGVYTIVFGTEEKYLQVFTALPAVEFAFSFEMSDTYSVGEYVRFPEAKITSAIEDGGDYTVYLEKDGTVIDRFESGEDLVFQPMSEGSYTAVYGYIDYFGYSSNRTIEFSVAGRPVIAFDPPASLAYGSTVQPGRILAYNGGESVDAVLEVYAPSGAKVDLSAGAFVASERGNYIYKVTAQIGGTELSREYTVPCDFFNEYLFTAERMAEEPVPGIPLPDTCKYTGDGVLLEGTASGAVFRYSQVINLNSITSDQNILTFFPYVADGYMETLEVKLTDIYDPYNEISMYFKRSPFHDDLTYITAAHNERHYAYDNENFVLTGVDGPVKIGDKYFFGGLMRDHYSMMGISDEPLSLYSFSMNYAERQMILDLTDAGEGRMVLMDFDNSVWCGGEQYVWDGFTTGEVYMTLEFGTITGDSAAIIVTEVMGQSVSGSVTEDAVPPAIVVDTEEEYLENMPYGVAGMTYQIPQAWAYDTVSGSADVRTQLFLGSEEIGFTGSAFVPEQAGGYEIVYTAADVRGNTAEIRLPFTVYQTAPQIGISMQETDTPVPGKYYRLPSFTIADASGNYEVSQTISYNGKTVEPDRAGKIFIDAVGKIDITVTVTDWLGQKAEKSFSVAVSTDDVTMTSPYRHAVAHVGQELVFEEPALSAFNGMDSAEILCEIYVNGTLLQGSAYTVPEGIDSLEVEYLVKVNGAEAAKETYRISVAAADGSLESAAENVRGLFDTDATMYFAGQESEEVRFSFAQDGYFELKNPVSHNQLRFSLSVPQYDFESLDVYFTDANNPDISVFLRITDYDLSNARLQLNGTGDYYMISGSVSRPGSPIVFLYDCDKLNFKRAVSESEIFAIRSCVNGDVFNGFTSGGVRIRVQVNGVGAVSGGTAEVRLLEASNEGFMAYLMTGSDLFTPVISVPTEQGTVTVRYGETYTVEPAKAFDVLDGVFDAAVTVTSPSGVKLADGVKEEVTFTLNEYGRYLVSYRVDSPYTETAAKELYVEVPDETAPEITVKGEPVREAALGDSMTVIGMTASDNLTEELNTRIFIYDPNYRNRIVQEGDSYRFTLRGTYKLVYYASDEAGNVSRITYNIEVK